MTKAKKYYWTFEDKEVEIVNSFIDPEYKKKWCVITDGNSYEVVSKQDLKTYKQTKWFLRRKELEKEIEKIKKDKDKIKAKIIKDALGELSTNIKLNLAFGEFGAGEMIISKTILEKLKKLIKEYGKEI